MNLITLRPANEADFDSILRLNDAEVQQTSAMDAERLHRLHRLSWYHRVVSVDGTVVAFLLAMRNDAPYVNENFAWFAARYTTFVYVDRIVVAASRGRQQLGSLLYRDLFAHARAEEVLFVTCEYNLFPENEPSRRFHNKFGFKEVGTLWGSSRTKLVSLQVAQT